MASDEDSEHESGIKQEQALGLYDGYGPEPGTVITCPTDGFEYILYVQAEREKYPLPKIIPCFQFDFADADSDDEEFQKKKLRQEWRRDFVSLQRFVEKIVERKLEFCPAKDEILPDINDQHAWCAFCLGTEVASKIQNKSMSKSCNLNPEGYLPLLHFVLSMKKADVQKLLSYHTMWLQHLGFSYRQGVWIHGLLTLLKKPFTNKTATVLHNLLLTCSKLRNESENDDFVNQLNFIMCILTGCFCDSEFELTYAMDRFESSTEESGSDTDETETDESETGESD